MFLDAIAQGETDAGKLLAGGFNRAANLIGDLAEVECLAVTKIHEFGGAGRKLLFATNERLDQLLLGGNGPRILAR